MLVKKLKILCNKYFKNISKIILKKLKILNVNNLINFININ